MFRNDGVKIAEYVWDFAVDGGAQAAKSLSAKAGKSSLPLGCLVKTVTAKVVTAVAGAGLTMIWGNTTDPDGYSGSANAVAALVDNAVFDGKETLATPGALLWTFIDNAADSALAKPPHPVLVANDADFLITIAGGNATAGKMIFLVEFVFPSLI